MNRRPVAEKTPGNQLANGDVQGWESELYKWNVVYLGLMLLLVSQRIALGVGRLWFQNKSPTNHDDIKDRMHAAVTVVVKCLDGEKCVLVGFMKHMGERRRRGNYRVSRQGEGGKRLGCQREPAAPWQREKDIPPSTSAGRPGSVGAGRGGGHDPAMR